jgi:hypothetical protein
LQALALFTAEDLIEQGRRCIAGGFSAPSIFEKLSFMLPVQTQTRACPLQFPANERKLSLTGRCRYLLSSSRMTHFKRRSDNNLILILKIEN